MSELTARQMRGAAEIEAPTPLEIASKIDVLIRFLEERAGGTQWCAETDARCLAQSIKSDVLRLLDDSR